jgi:hypothetical protein
VTRGYGHQVWALASRRVVKACEPGVGDMIKRQQMAGTTGGLPRWGALWSLDERSGGTCAVVAAAPYAAGPQGWRHRRYMSMLAVTTGAPGSTQGKMREVLLQDVQPVAAPPALSLAPLLRQLPPIKCTFRNIPSIGSLYTSCMVLEC